jgi:signal transduction histidine kinase
MAPEQGTARAGGPRSPSLPERSGPGLSWPIIERRRSVDGSPGPNRRADEAVPGLSKRIALTQAPPIEPFRWASIAIGLILATTQNPPDLSATKIGVTIALIIYAAFRTMRPIPYDQQRSTTVEIWIEFVLHTVAVLVTGAWTSPYTLALLPTVALAGFAHGAFFAFQLSALCAAVISAHHMITVVPDDWVRATRDSAAWIGLFLVVSIVVGFARQVLAESARQQSIALDRLGRLAEANSLLFSLHRVAQTLPASLDLSDVLTSTLARLRDLIDFDATTILLLEDSDSSWVPARSSGQPFRRTLSMEQLPAPMRQAMAAAGTVSIPDLGTGGPGLHEGMRAGLYSALHARGALIGLIAVESTRSGPFDTKDVELLNGLVEPFGVAIDNARWFARLRAIGADEERSRIARDLHDQIGQALAHLGFELDRAVRAADRGHEMKPVLEELRGQVREVVRTVRETLYDLRTDVTETQDFGTTMEMFLDRVRERAGLQATLHRSETGRLPLLQERELWRIAKEAVINVERHARATSLELSWRCDGATAELIVRDDGRGFDRANARSDSYGIIGMRERASTVGARFEVESAPGAGTTVRVILAR